MLRDSRFRTPPGLGLETQGITSGPLWDMNSRNIVSLDGAEHHRLRKVVSKAFTPGAAERLRATIVDVITELVDPLTDAADHPNLAAWPAIADQHRSQLAAVFIASLDDPLPVAATPRSDIGNPPGRGRGVSFQRQHVDDGGVDL